MKSHNQSQPARLSTWTNCGIFFLFYFFSSVISTGFGAAGLLTYTGHWHMSYVSWNIAFLIGFIVQVYAQMAIGYVSDNIKTRWGRRKPLIALGWLVQSAGMVLLAMPPGFSQSILFGWFTFCYCLYMVGFGLVFIPFGAWLVESTADDADYRYIASTVSAVGQVLGYATSIYPGLMVYVGGLITPLYFGFLYFLGMGVTMYLLITIVPNPTLRSVEKQPPLIPSMRTCLRTFEFKILFINEILIQSAGNIGATMAQYYLIFGFPDEIKTYANFQVVLIVVALSGVLGGALFMILTGFVLKYKDKLLVYRWLMLFVALLGILLLTATLVSSAYFFIGIACVLAMISYPVNLIDGIMLRDLINYDTLVTGLRRASTYSMAIAVPTSLIGRIIVSIPTIIVLGSGLNSPDADDDKLSSLFEWNEAVKVEVQIFSSVLMLLIAAAAYFIILKYPINTKIADQINTAVHAKEAAMGTEGGGVDDDNSKIGLKNKMENGHGGGSDSELALGHNIADNRDEMLMLHFSSFEIECIHADPCSSGKNATIMTIYYQAVLGVILALVPLGLCPYGVVIQYQKGNGNYAQVLIIVALFITIYICYEALRYRPLRALRYEDVNVVREMARVAKDRNNTYQESLQELLSKNGVGDDQSGVGSSSSSSSSSEMDEHAALSAPLTGRPSNLVHGLDGEKPGHLPGYKRIYSVLLALTAFALLSIFVL